MIKLDIARIPIGTVGRGFELTRKYGRTFDRWECHYGTIKHVAVVPVGEGPPPRCACDGIQYTLEAVERRTFRAYYIAVANT